MFQAIAASTREEYPTVEMKEGPIQWEKSAFFNAGRVEELWKAALELEGRKTASV